MPPLPQFVLDYLLTASICLSTFVTLFLLTLPSRYSTEHDSNSKSPRRSTSVQIVVLGDIGRSPRMEYHALSIAKHGAELRLLASLVRICSGKSYHTTTKLIHIDRLGCAPRDQEKPLNHNCAHSRDAFFSANQQQTPCLSFCAAQSFMASPRPVLCSWVQMQGLSLDVDSSTLLHSNISTRASNTNHKLQNPPFIPTFAIASFIAFVRNTKVVIDWHNFGHSIYALKLGASHPLVKFYRFFELHAARFASAHFTVTNAMARVLKRDARIIAHPLHDRPPEYFQPLTAKQRSEFLQRFPPTSDMSKVAFGECRLLVSPTSWTADENFSLLLDALVDYSSLARKQTELPSIIAVITGKGPQKEYYLSKIQQLTKENKLERVSITTAWLSMEDYALLLGSADLGVSLHTSSSGVDLPMKVVDMFGTGLPVAGWSQFEAWPELVQENINGRGFGSAQDLTALFIELFRDGGKDLLPLRKGAMKECSRRWDAEWDKVAMPVLDIAE